MTEATTTLRSCQDAIEVLGQGEAALRLYLAELEQLREVGSPAELQLVMSAVQVARMYVQNALKQTAPSWWMQRLDEATARDDD